MMSMAIACLLGLIFDLFIKVEVVHEHPNGEKLLDVVTRDEVLWLILRIHVFPLRASLTFQVFLPKASNISGAMSFGLRPRRLVDQ